MKVRDLIRKLQVHDPDAEVVTHADAGDSFTYMPATYVAQKHLDVQGMGYEEKMHLPPHKTLPAVLIA